jgi:hypothetical protein
MRFIFGQSLSWQCNLKINQTTTIVGYLIKRCQPKSSFVRTPIPTKIPSERVVEISISSALGVWPSRSFGSSSGSEGAELQ